MQQSSEPTAKQRIVEAFSRTVYSLRYVFAGLLTALLLFVIVYLVAAEVRDRRAERSSVIVERIEDDFALWVEQEESADRQTMQIDLLDRIDSLLAQYPRLYSAQRALQLRGRIYYETAAWDQARAAFVELADRFPKSYLAPIALVNAATAMEEAGRYDVAIELLLRITEDFETPEMPAVLFSLGRLNETVGKPDAAVRFYERLLDEYPSSGWTSPAQSRIILLKIDRS